jgi:hypothetical protein
MPPVVPIYGRMVRNIVAAEPRVTRYQIALTGHDCRVKGVRFWARRTV